MCDEPGLLTRAKILVLMHVVGQVDDVELRRVGARKQGAIARQKGDVVCQYLRGDGFTNQYSMWLKLYGIFSKILTGIN